MLPVISWATYASGGCPIHMGHRWACPYQVLSSCAKKLKIPKTAVAITRASYVCWFQTTPTPCRPYYWDSNQRFKFGQNNKVCGLSKGKYLSCEKKQVVFLFLIVRCLFWVIQGYLLPVFLLLHAQIEDRWKGLLACMSTHSKLSCYLKSIPT